MNDLRKAAEMALEALEDVEQAYGSHSEWFKKRLEALRQALAQPEQEPVGTYQDVMQKMLALRHGSLEQMQAYDYLKNTPLYTAPPKRDSSSWVGLTHREMQELMAIRFIDDAVLATEAKLKEKNGG